MAFVEDIGSHINLGKSAKVAPYMPQLFGLSYAMWFLLTNNFFLNYALSYYGLLCKVF